MIYKYALNLHDGTHVPGQVLSTALDPSGALCVWARVDPEQAQAQAGEVVTVWLTGTPGPTDPRERFIGTVCDRWLVVHVFARPL